MNKPELFNEDYQATYCPEDDKLRLYVGRVPRAEYDALRAEGWTSTPKQSEAGQGEFAAVWTQDREDTALSYAGVILDEDAGPAERAADRAERFGGYLGRDMDRATGHLDKYDSRDTCHGFQSKAAAVRAADRHDRIADRAVNAWDKAEYWTRRTEGVISHALHVASPSVRMGRIKTLEAELRKAEKSWKESTEEEQGRYDSVLSVVEYAEGTREKITIRDRSDFLWHLSKIRHAERTPDGEKSTPEQVRRAALMSAFSGWHASATDKASAKEAEQGTRPAADIAREWLAANTRPADWNPEEGSRYTRHLRLRLAYENQMLAAQGGRAASLDMVKGGTFTGGVIAKVNKSTATGRVVSVAVIVPRVEGWHYQVSNEPGTPYALMTIKTERAKPGSYREPTPESLAKLAEFEEARKQAQAAHKAKVPPCPLVNPTEADAERLQEMLNAENEKCPWRQRNHTEPPSTTVRLTQAEYSRVSGGSYSSAETTEICPLGMIPERSNMYSREKEERNKRIGAPVCKVRTMRGKGYTARRVVILTDKPQKPLPPAVWVAPVVPESVLA